MSNLDPLISSLEQLRDQHPDANHDAIRIQDVLNSWIKNEGRRMVQDRLDMMLENGGDKVEAGSRTQSRHLLAALQSGP